MTKNWKASDPPTMLDRIWAGTKGDPNLTLHLTAALGWLIDECKRRAELEETQ